MTTNSNTKNFVKHTEDSLMVYSSEDLTYVKYSGFRNKHFLKSVDLPNVTEIKELSFSDNDGLETINVPNCTKIGRKAFYNCKNLDSLSVSKVTEIGDYALYNCEKIEELDLPLCTKVGTKINSSWDSDGASSIIGCSFKNCKSLSVINLPLCESVGPNTFENCSKLTSILLPNCTTVGANCFLGCENIETLDLSNVTVGTSNLFSGLGENTIIIAPKLETMEDEVIENSNIKTFSSSSIKTIETYSMQSAQKLEVLDLTAVVSIGAGAFAFCSSLKKVWIQSTCKTISVNGYYRPFTGCPSTCQIYTNLTSKPSGWQTYWNGYVANGTDTLTVHWGATHEQFLAA